jgi:acetyl-CoA carboxylase biotin carboxyl carrier protein
MRERDLQRLIELLEEHPELGEIELAESLLGGRRLRVARRAGIPAAAPAPNPGAAAATPASPAADPEPDAGLQVVKAPMVGTFYRASSPDADPFVREGTRVAPGSVLCIIEAMKLMNEIESEVAGVVRKIRVENGQPVEFGQVLFLIETA